MLYFLNTLCYNTPAVNDLLGYGGHLPAPVLIAKANIMKGGYDNDPGKKAGNYQGVCYSRG